MVLTSKKDVIWGDGELGCHVQEGASWGVPMTNFTRVGRGLLPGQDPHLCVGQWFSEYH